MSTILRGNASEAAVLDALIRMGVCVLVPFGEGHPFDLVASVDGARFLRVQCKTAWRSRGCLLFNAYATDHGRGPVPYTGLADLFGVYHQPDNAVFLVPVGDVPSDGRLRVEPTRNNQRKRIHFAADYEIGCWSHERLLAI